VDGQNEDEEIEDENDNEIEKEMEALALESFANKTPVYEPPVAVADTKNLNLESVLLYHEEMEEGVERHLATNLDYAFAPCRLFMLAVFRFPLQLSIRRDFSRQFSYSWKSLRGWMFFITGALMIFSGILALLTLLGVLLDWPTQPAKFRPSNNSEVKTGEILRLEELFLLQRNFVPVLIVLLALIHVCSGSYF
jgi:hypothetical protein